MLCPRSEKKYEDAAQDHSAGDDQERQILAGLPSTGFSAALEILHHAHLKPSYAHAKGRTDQSCSVRKQAPAHRNLGMI